jgi:hypothetical protein
MWVALQAAVGPNRAHVPDAVTRLVEGRKQQQSVDFDRNPDVLHNCVQLGALLSKFGFYSGNDSIAQQLGDISTKSDPIRTVLGR